MQNELRSEWVKALRSGEYVQGEGKLYSDYDGTYCCLGVLCRILPDALIKFNGVGFYYWSDEDDEPYDDICGDPGFYAGWNEFDEEQLPEIVLKAVGLNYDAQSELINRNDGGGDYNGEGQSFSEIADFIESEKL